MVIKFRYKYTDHKPVQLGHSTLIPDTVNQITLHVDIHDHTSNFTEQAKTYSKHNTYCCSLNNINNDIYFGCAITQVASCQSLTMKSSV